EEIAAAKTVLHASLSVSGYPRRMTQSLRLSIEPGKTVRSTPTIPACMHSLLRPPSKHDGVKTRHDAGYQRGGIDDRHGLYSLPARSVPPRSLRSLRQALAGHYPKMRRRARRLLDAARGDQQYCLRADFVRESVGVRS